MASIPTIPANNRRRTNNARGGFLTPVTAQRRPTDRPPSLPSRALTSPAAPLEAARAAGSGLRQLRGTEAPGQPLARPVTHGLAEPRPQRRRRPAPRPPFRGAAGAQPAAPARERHGAEERGRVAEEYRRSWPDAPRTDGRRERAAAAPAPHHPGSTYRAGRCPRAPAGPALAGHHGNPLSSAPRRTSHLRAGRRLCRESLRRYRGDRRFRPAPGKPRPCSACWLRRRRVAGSREVSSRRAAVPLSPAACFGSDGARRSGLR